MSEYSRVSRVQLDRELSLPLPGSRYSPNSPNRLDVGKNGIEKIEAAPGCLIFHTTAGTRFGLGYNFVRWFEFELQDVRTVSGGGPGEGHNVTPVQERSVPNQSGESRGLAVKGMRGFQKRNQP